jgi:hypothetical protein
VLFKTTLTLAILLSGIYACGFLFVLIGKPIDQYIAVLDLIRSGAMCTWIAWVVVLVGERLNAANEAREQRRAHAERERAADVLALSIRRFESPGSA